MVEKLNSKTIYKKKFPIFKLFRLRLPSKFVIKANNTQHFCSFKNVIWVLKMQNLMLISISFKKLQKTHAKMLSTKK